MMRTNIDLDDDLLEQAQRLAGTTTKKATKKAAVQAALADFVRRHDRQRSRALFGSVEWTGDLDDMRATRVK